MKPFKALSAIDQRRRYLRNLDQSLARWQRQAVADNREAIEKVTAIHPRISALNEKLGRIEDRVANAADRKYGGPFVWRRKLSLMRKVRREMDRRTQDQRLMIQVLRDQIDALLKPMHRAFELNLAQRDQLAAGVLRKKRRRRSE